MFIPFGFPKSWDLLWKQWQNIQSFGWGKHLLALHVLVCGLLLSLRDLIWELRAVKPLLSSNTCPYMLIVSYFEAHSTASFNISSVCQLPCTHIQHYHFYVFLAYGFVNTIAKRGSPLLQFLVVCANFVVNVAVNFVVFWNTGCSLIADTCFSVHKMIIFSGLRSEIFELETSLM